MNPYITFRSEGIYHSFSYYPLVGFFFNFAVKVTRIILEKKLGLTKEADGFPFIILHTWVIFQF